MWNEIHNEYPDSPFAPLSLLASGELSWKKQDYGSSMQAYETYLKKYPKHPLIKRVYVQMGAILDAQRDFVKAREWYEKGRALTVNDPAASADIELLIARSYQKEGNWEKAEEMFKKIETDYKNSTAALQIPFLYAAHYEAAGETDKVHNVLNDAIQRYQGLSEGSNASLAAYAERLQNAAIAEKGDWQQLLGNFDRKLAKETSPERKGNWFFLKAVVTENRLQNRAAALELYKSFLAQYPNHPLTELAKTRQDSLLQQA
jgi:pentatricopeptide repeat protein